MATECRLMHGLASLTLALLAVATQDARASEEESTGPLETMVLSERAAPDPAPAASRSGIAPVAGVYVAASGQSPEGGPRLDVDDVLASSNEHMPRILEALALARAAEGDIVSAMGAFDLVVRSEGFARVSGFWDGRIVDNRVEQAFGPFGAKAYAGYRISGGRFPIYEDINFTNDLGEAKVGVVLSLLRDRDIDARRGAIRQGRLGVEVARTEALLARIGVQHQALLAYFDWVAAGMARDVYTDLLQLAEDRQAALSRRVAQGDAAEILLTENAQNLARRQTLLVDAERNLANAAITLSQYYRTDGGGPREPAPARLPGVFPAYDPAAIDDPAADIERARSIHPDLQIVDARLQKARLDRALGENELQPDLTVGTELSHDFGDVAAGGISRDSTDTVLSFKFSMPLQRRFAEGRIDRATAEMRALRFRRQFLEERIGMEIRRLVIDIRTAAQTVRLAEQEVRQAIAMQAAERRRFSEGGSDFFVVNRREEAAADARIRLVAAERRLHRALADYRAATVDLDALGIRAGV